MKKYSIYYLFAIFAVTGLSSCLEGEPVFEDGESTGIVELSLPARTTATPYAVKTTTIEVVDEVELPIEVNYTGVDGAPQDVQVTLAIDDAAIAKYDASGATLALPASSYELPSSNVITIPKGQKKAVYTIKVRPKTLDLTKSYALGVKIANASSGIISGNYSTGIYSLPVKSPWEGTYDVTYIWHIGGGAGTEDETYEEKGVVLSTAAPGVVEARYVGYWFNGYTRYTFFPDSSIGVFVYSGSDRTTGVIESHANIDNKTFHVRYWFIAPTSYELEEIYVKTGD
jgi:hypothetical protein